LNALSASRTGAERNRGAQTVQPRLRTMNRTFHIITFGCQMNKLDSELVEGVLLSRGWQRAPSPDAADALIYNTCSVRQHAEERVFSHLGSWRRRAEKEPDFILGVMGCVAQRLGMDIVRQFPHVRLVCGTHAFLRIPDYLDRIALTGQAVVATEEEPLDVEGALRPPPGGHHAFISIMRGCNNYCSYCIVPYVRGREVSRPPQSILDEAKRLVESGVVEVTLLGQNVNSYGRGLDKGTNLATLLRGMNEIAGLRRIRFLTNHPKDMSEEVFRAVAEIDKVCEHIHMPAQSGSNAVLKRMNRNYTRERYLELIEAGRRLIPHVEFSSDFIVGFPGETEEDFELTLQLLKDVRFQQSFIFRYSPRPGTGAARWADDVPDAVKHYRQQALLAAQAEEDSRRRASLVGAALEVMCEGENRSQPHEGQCIGRTRQNDIVVFSGPHTPPGSVCTVRVTGSTTLTLFGRRMEGAP
jgi:tRNA-2-methylthio-N6-dimethylallyladenosine synthase